MLRPGKAVTVIEGQSPERKGADGRTISERVRAWVRDTTQAPPGLELHRAYAESAGL